MTKRRVTIKDIARRASVAPSTVSRALRDNPWIPRHTRNRIKALAEEMGYVPCSAARELKGRSSRTIGVCLPDLKEGTLAEQVEAIHRIALEHRFKLLVALFEGSRKRELECVQDFMERRMEVILVFGSHTSLSGALGHSNTSRCGANGPTSIVMIEGPGRYSNHRVARDAIDSLLGLMVK